MILKNIFRKIALLPLLGLSFNAYAVPGYWSYHSVMLGAGQYHLQNESNNLLVVNCATEYELTGDNSVEFYKVAYAQMVESDSDILSTWDDWRHDKLSFLFDDKVSAMPTSESKSREGSNSWRKFINGISAAKKIDVFSHNKKVATFHARNINSDDFSDISSTCASLN